MYEVPEAQTIPGRLILETNCAVLDPEWTTSVIAANAGTRLLPECKGAIREFQFNVEPFAMKGGMIALSDEQVASFPAAHELLGIEVV